MRANIPTFLQDQIPLTADPFGGPPVQVANPSMIKPQEAAAFIEFTTAFAKVFDLSKPQDLIDYNTVIDGVAKGFAQLSSEERQFITEKQNWVIFLRWQSTTKCPESAARANLTPAANNWVNFNKRINTELKEKNNEQASENIGWGTTSNSDSPGA